MSVKCAARCNDFAASIDDRLAATQHLPKPAYKSQWSGECRVSSGIEEKAEQGNAAIFVFVTFLLL